MFPKKKFYNIIHIPSLEIEANLIARSIFTQTCIQSRRDHIFLQGNGGKEGKVMIGLGVGELLNGGEEGSSWFVLLGIN